MIPRFAIVVCLALSMSNVCNGDFIINITDAGLGKSLFTFSGTTTATGNGTFAGTNDQGDFTGLFAFASGTDILDNSLESNSGQIQNQTQNITRTLDSIRFRKTTNDDLITLGVNQNLTINNNDILVASGSFVADIAFSSFNIGTFTAITARSGTWQINVTAVPEPSSLALCSVIAAAFALRRRRRANGQ
jgi:hypothetical protein